MSYKVQVDSSSHEFNVEREEDILGAATRQGINLPYGCRNGFCGECRATLISGKVSYPNGEPPAMAGGENGICYTCQAVPSSDLVIGVTEILHSQDIRTRIMPCKIDRIERLNEDVIRLYLKLPEGERLQFMAGQYLNFVLQDGSKRAFSIANAPHDDEALELHIRHVSGGAFTDTLFNGMKEKTILRIEAPLGSYYLREDSQRPIILMGGGTGFAPLKGIIEHALRTGMQRPMHLYWGVRSRTDLYLPELPEKWAAENSNFNYTPVLSEPDQDWRGKTGWVHEAVVADHRDLSGHQVYMSGPPPMIEAGKETFLAHGLSGEALFSDSFEYGAAAVKRK
ncbi:MAG: CDP-6-deoxy-delta-3,4-glucoseen reductase [Candidatus Thiodiazotropha sp. (ex Dulcina madagascariensis)]|nr:CDP-6-deoxy-delta-3,4-glucoseen reductase [Candidatus Thiodiazotropha sp. (ex Dulcina madagascariensis)]MCU7924856.1 CDP-6-deoxy-delta-3,4-glucoseen reductase [Candidatus Thiodiazotropha sp. (ex Dulcina madagascariensis)]